MPKQFWGEAVSKMCYLINRTLSTAIDFKTPQEVWLGKPPSFDNLKVFGCVAYAHVKQDKLDPRAKKCVFLGYPEGVKGYRLWSMEPGEAKVIISRDVVFDETKYYKDLVGEKSNVQAAPRDKGVEIEVERAVDKQIEEDDAVLEGDSSFRHYQLAQDRERREIRPPTRLGFADMTAFALISAANIGEDEPISFREAVDSKHGDLWIQAINEEMDSLMKNETWTLVERPKG